GSAAWAAPSTTPPRGPARGSRRRPGHVERGARRGTSSPGHGSRSPGARRTVGRSRSRPFTRSSRRGSLLLDPGPLAGGAVRGGRYDDGPAVPEHDAHLGARVDVV